MRQLKIEYLTLDQLKPYAKNARAHHPDDVKAIVNSICEFGFDDPIGIWGDNEIVEGHGRLLAAQEIGLDRVPCIRLDHLTDEQRRAYALAHNKTAELSGWNFELLDAELSGIDDIDMSLFGFELPGENDQQEIEEDDPPDVPEETETKVGDLWKLGGAPSDMR